jgi:hypothetical protein
VKLDLEGNPTCIAVGEDGFLYAGYSDHIKVFDFRSDWKHARWDVPSEKAFLTSIAVDEWYVYTADAGSRRIWRYNKEGGEPLEIGKKDWANGVRGFYVPSPFFDIAISRSDGSLWAVNPGYHALENYRPDGMPLSMWENSGFNIEGFSGCCNPAHFALLPDGGFVTAEKGLPRVKIHNVSVKMDASTYLIRAATRSVCSRRKNETNRSTGISKTLRTRRCACGHRGSWGRAGFARKQVRVFRPVPAMREV